MDNQSVLVLLLWLLVVMMSFSSMSALVPFLLSLFSLGFWLSDNLETIILELSDFLLLEVSHSDFSFKRWIWIGFRFLILILRLIVGFLLIWVIVSFLLCEFLLSFSSGFSGDSWLSWLSEFFGSSVFSWTSIVFSWTSVILSWTSVVSSSWSSVITSGSVVSSWWSLLSLNWLWFFSFYWISLTVD